MFNILVVEDDTKLNYIICAYLNRNGYNAYGCKNPIEGFDKMASTMCDLIISDIMMPEMDGFEFAKVMREQDKTMPILFITSRDDISSKQKGFRIGIDDYMVKPIDMDELILHVGALLRRANIANARKITIGRLEMNIDEMTATLDGKEIPITVKEFNILYKLLSYPKRTFTRSQLMDEFWGLSSESGCRTVDVYITKIRNKFSDCKDFEIVTVHGLGYKAVLK
ncbi:response regulator transcription factor [Clostridium estertheticum]|uniref:response regulator transcription factor n=1 Tax=Clostridium estertheticum TaxID=238834 RepID=UPI001C0CA078|nr:response regulator transcription factor [Clostridium estertheticum]MBU3201348.1 response regulator transcription factor [Clostridium estertheticum]WAG66647.1 response regulator transcription factor [Clostridium estertheticum]